MQPPPSLSEAPAAEEEAVPAVPPSPLRSSMPAYTPFTQPCLAVLRLFNEEARQIPRGYGAREEVGRKRRLEVSSVQLLNSP